MQVWRAFISLIILFTKATADIWFLLLWNMANKIQFNSWYIGIQRKIIFHKDKLDIIMYSFSISIDNR